MNYYHWIIPIILIFLLSGFYIGIKLKVLIKITPKKSKIIYWIIVYLTILSLFLCRTIFVGFFLYFILLNLLFDFLKIIANRLPSKRLYQFLNKIYFYGIPIIIICFTISIYSIYNVNHPVIKEYDIKLNQKLERDLTIGMISDLHLGTIHSEDLLNQIVLHANDLNVDLFILGGDIFDEYTSKDLIESAITAFGKIKTTYGIFYVEGNHDLLTQERKEKFLEHNIQVLDDQIVQIDSLINLIGRKDYRNNYLNNDREKLENLVKQAKKDLPIILIDHQPRDQILAESLGIDLQLSGHTHAGQIFPANLFLQYGYKKRNNYQIIVSSGYGVWGFPIRTAGRSEMIKIKLSN